MGFKRDYSDIVKRAFAKHGVDNLELENVLTDILEEVLEPNSLARELHDEITEEQRIQKDLNSGF